MCVLYEGEVSRTRKSDEDNTQVVSKWIPEVECCISWEQEWRETKRLGKTRKIRCNVRGQFVVFMEGVFLRLLQGKKICLVLFRVQDTQSEIENEGEIKVDRQGMKSWNMKRFLRRIYDRRGARSWSTGRIRLNRVRESLILGRNKERRPPMILERKHTEHRWRQESERNDTTSISIKHAVNEDIFAELALFFHRKEEEVSLSFWRQRWWDASTSLFSLYASFKRVSLDLSLPWLLIP
jgi:hypothetical protein